LSFEDLLTELPFGLNGRIYRSPLPFSPFFDPQRLVLDAYLDVGVDTVVMLTTAEEVERLLGFNLADQYKQLGFDVIYAPVDDFSVPSKGGFQEPIEKALQAANAGRTIALHCHAGLGRTGMFAACLSKVVFGLDGEEASAWVRQYIPKAVETQEQHQFINDFQYGVD
jgi:protein-tyrosine phosphatase